MEETQISHSADQVCNATKEELLANGKRDVVDLCPVCEGIGVRRMIGCHPSAAQAIATTAPGTGAQNALSAIGAPRGDSDERASKRMKLSIAEQSPLDQEGGVVHVGHKKLAGFSSEESLLYVRHETVELWNALNDPEGDNNSLSIDGPPGTGKSTEVWAWALWKAKQDKVQVTWFHLTKRQIVKVLIDGSTEQITTGYVPGNLDDIANSEGSILIVDGIIASNNTQVSFSCCNWRSLEKDRRFILVSSVSVPVALQENQEADIVEFTLSSWTFDQYLSACANNVFFEEVKSNLECPGTESVTDMEQLLLAKYYFAGGCARWMFEFNYFQWKSDFDKHLEKVSNYILLFWGGGGDQNVVAVNHLRGLTVLATDGIKENKYFFVSQFAAEALAKKCDNKRKFLVDSYGQAAATKNPAFEGWIFEFDVDYQLDQACSNPSSKFHSKIRSPINDHTTVTEERVVNKYVVFQSVKELSDEIKSLEFDQVLWAKPYLWCQKAYDFLCVWKEMKDDSEHMTMVVANATLAATHSLKLDEVHKLACDLFHEGCAVSAIRFDFIVPEDAHFNVSQITGRLCEWKNLEGNQWPNTDNTEILGVCLALRHVARTVCSE